VAGLVYETAGGNPLTLRLAAELYRREPAGVDQFLAEDFAKKLFAERRDAYLFERILKHIHDLGVRALALPGLVLRRITPDLIREVLAGPCEVRSPTRRRRAGCGRSWPGKRPSSASTRAGESSGTGLDCGRR
jgi:hypothetical protein